MVIESLLNWSAEQPLWQQDSLRHTAISTDVCDADNLSILDNLKHDNGLEQKGEINCDPLTANHLQPDAENAPRAQLCSIDRVLDVNGLAAAQFLPFGLDGTTVIYGENGSGKSGCCRISEKLCHALVIDDLLPEDFVESAQAAAQARVRFKLDGENDVREEAWHEAGQCDGLRFRGASIPPPAI